MQKALSSGGLLLASLQAQKQEDGTYAFDPAKETAVLAALNAAEQQGDAGAIEDDGDWNIHGLDEQTLQEIAPGVFGGPP